MPGPADDERSGYGGRRGWRAPKGTGGPGRRRGRPRTGRPAAGPSADPEGEDRDDVAGRLARLAGLSPAEAADLRAGELPAAGAPDLLPAGLRALGALVRAAKDETLAAGDRADQAAEHRTRDGGRARERIERAEQRLARQATKADQEQGERQRLTGELERVHARMAQVAAERDRLRELAREPVDAGGSATESDPLLQRSSPQDDAVVAGLLARVADLEGQLEDRAVALEQLTDAREAAEAEREHLRHAARRMRRLALEAGSADVDLVDPEDHGPLRVDDLPHARTVLEAVELAAAHAEHLVYTDRAFSSARTAPYDEPRKLLRDLVALDRVAAAWAVQGGVGRPIRDVALAQQLEWADDVSSTARNQHPREYGFTHQGRPLWAGPHVRVATGRGLQRTCRVYLALVKGGEADLAGLPRGIYVGPVGRHLSDSTSG